MNINLENNKLDYRSVTKPYLKNWKWFLAALVISLVLAFLYLRYTTPQYMAEAKIQILDDEASGSELGLFADLEILTSGNIKVEDEIEILNSRSNMIDIVRELGLNVKIEALGRFHDSETYNEPPVNITFLVPDSLISTIKDQFTIRIISPTTFEYEIEDKTLTKNYSFGSTISTDFGEFVLTPAKPNMSSLINNEYRISILPVTEVARYYQENLVISITGEMSNIISISLTDPVEQKALEILNLLIDTYNGNAIADKKEIADRTEDFINERIRDISGNLSTVDDSAEEYKTSRGITDVASQSNVNLTVSAESRQMLQDARIQLDIASSMQNYIDNQSGYEVLPMNMASDPNVGTTTARYNELVAERKRLLKSSNEKNPVIVALDEELRGLKRSLQSSLSSLTNNLTLRTNDLSRQLAQINASIYSAPGKERALRDITRQQQTTEALYLYLLQKREEAQITYASASPKSKVIDRPYGVSPDPVSPKNSIVLLASFILGLLVPFSVIYVKTLLDNKVHNKVELEKLVGDIPVLGELPKMKKKDNKLVRPNERTVLAESLRILRANMDYLIKTRTRSTNGKVIYVTSCTQGEGKTFVTSNLAMIYAKANKKVLLLGADIRNPKLYQFYTGKNVDKLVRGLQNKNNKGFTDYISDTSLGVKDITSTLLVFDSTIDVIFSGKLPPNPSELLMSERVSELMDEVRDQYDFIIVDTAPLMLVSDTLLISEYADQTLLVTRAHETELNVLDFPLKLHEEGKIKGISFVVNGVKDTNLGYGGRYGYGYSASKPSKKWWKLTG